MKKIDSLNLKLPILYVNPSFHTDPALIEQTSRLGGLGIVDHVTAGPSDLRVSGGTKYGMRIPFDELANLQYEQDVALIVLPLEEADRLSALDPAKLKEVPCPVVAEVGSAKQAVLAEAAGASGLIVRGNEGPGWVSETSGLVLLQEIIEATDLPLFLQGGIGLRSAAGAMAAGAAGIVLDCHLLLASDSGLNPSFKDFLRSLSLPATVNLGEFLDSPLRVYSRIGTRMVRELRKEEASLTSDEQSAYGERLKEILRKPIEKPDSDDGLLPVSDDIVTAKNLTDRFQTSAAIITAFAEKMAKTAVEWPFHADSGLCRSHGTRFPIVQGPMAHVSDNPDFLASVAEAGALPFLAMGNMPAPIAREGIELARQKTAGKFGVGLIGLAVNRKVYEAHLEIISENPPPYAILAAGNVDLAKRIEDMGTVCYLHCPAPAVLKEGLSAGHRRFVFEGCEAGGHIGTLSSLDLWNANLQELETAAENGLALSEVFVLFAGGIASGRASAFVAGMIEDLVSRGLNAGLQMGTAYLTTDEAVSTCAITSTYRKLALEESRTVVIGKTVNTRARAVGSPMASELIAREEDRVREGIPLRERKELFETDNLGALRLASKGCAIDPETATWDCPVFCDLPPEEQIDRGLYLIGQGISVLDSPTNMESLHATILDQGRSIFESRTESQEIEEVSLLDIPETEDLVEVGYNEEPIAVVGIGLRFPGSNSPETFWNHIVERRNGIGPVPATRWGNSDLYYDPDPKAPDKTYTILGGFIEDFTFDPLSYRIPPAVAKKMDRTQQLAVTCVADALKDAGLTADALKGQKVGIVLGNSMGGETTDNYAKRVNLPNVLSALQESIADLGVSPEKQSKLLEEFSERYLEDLPGITEDSLPGELSNVISGRVANVFNLEGPNFTVDAACASSMAAVMNAASQLRNGSMDLAVSGGVDAAMHPSSFVKFCKIGALSPDGSRPFDEGANGFVMGEGAGIMILKRLSDAVRDRDRIYGLIMAIGSSSDGRGKGITAPNAAGQERAVRNCLEPAGIEPNSVGLIEAHGTSTPVGDKTELSLLDQYFRRAGAGAGTIGIGSVKSQIGHLKAAAGAAGMIKTLLSLYHRTLPPTINVKTPNPCIEWSSSPLFLLTNPKPWEPPSGRLRRAGVSAFGFGGTNFHVVIQEHRPELRLVPTRALPARPVEFSPPDWPRPPDMNIQGEAWVLGGESPEVLADNVGRVLEKLAEGNLSLLAKGCRNQAKNATLRCGFAARDLEETEKKLRLILDGLKDEKKRSFFPARGIHVSQGNRDRRKAGIAFLFPGQGSQYPFMLRDLADRFPIVTETLVEADDILTGLGLPAITDTIFSASNDDADSASKNADAMKDTQLLQPLILTANTAVYRLLSAMGVKPVACAGHSLGEYAACVAAEVFTFRDALQAVAVRGREMARVSIADPGLMMGIPADARIVEEVLAEVDGYVVAANKNSPQQTLISGETAAVKQAGELFKQRGLPGVLIPVSAAFHSGVVAPAREPFMKTLKRLTVNGPSIPVLSNVTGDFYPVGPAAPERIRDLLGKQFAAPVEWVKTLRRLYSEGVRLFLECGPKRVMTNLTLDTLSDDILAMPTNHPKKGGIIQLMESLAALAAEGVPVNFSGAEASAGQPRAEETDARPSLTVVTSQGQADGAPPVASKDRGPELLEALLDEEIRMIAKRKEFDRFLEIQGEPIRSLIKSGFDNFVTNVLPMDKAVQQVKSEGIDFQPVVVSGLSAGLPGDVRFPFDKESLDDLILGRNFIKQVPEEGRRRMLEKNVERLFKGPAGEAELQVVEDVSGVIKLAGFFNEEQILEEYGLDNKLIGSMDVTTKLAMAAGIECLRDAGIPLARQTRTTSTGKELPDAWALPEPLRDETGVIFASAFPGLSSLVDEVTRDAASRYGSRAKARLIDFYSGLVERIKDHGEKEKITRWFVEEFEHLDPAGTDELYTFNRNFLLRVMTLGSGQLAQFIRARGPNTHVDAACASTTQAVLLARDWIRAGQAKRVVVVAADDVAGRTLLPWIGSGFLAMGAATTNANVSEAALPFDDRRHGLILGSAAVGMVLEKEDLVQARGMEGIASVEAGIVANSAYHGTRLDVDHISSLMQRLVSKWEQQSGGSRQDLAEKVFFMSHETYSPKRGGSSAAEISALRTTFGDKAGKIPIANTKGFTGHTMGVGVEDVVAVRCLQKKMLPPIPNLKQPDPDFADLNLSRGGPCDADYVLRLAAGFGSQIVMALYKVLSREENRIFDLSVHRDWLKGITSYSDPLVSVEDRTLKVSERPSHQVAASGGNAANDAASLNAEVSQVPAVKSGGEEHVREKILALLAEKTGYPADMLDTGLDLEADLGIDTVKQAEFITEVREAFGIPRIDGLKIADFPTIERIIGFVLERTDASDDESRRTGPAPQSKSAVSNEKDVREKILSLLSEKTGYPSDMLDTDLDLEADLGIDTVKQAEFITEVREMFGIPRIEGLKIAEFPTIEHIIGFVQDQAGTSESTQQEIDSEVSTEQATDGTGDRGKEVLEKILSLLSEKTGYPADMLDPDLDLEADLGIDTVKQAEFITEVREMFGIPRIEGLKIADFPTIEHIVDFVLERSQKLASGTDVSESEETATEAVLAGEEIRLYETRLIDLPIPEKISLPEVKEVLVVGGPESLSAEVRNALHAVGFQSARAISQTVLPEDVRGKKIGIVNLFPLDSDSDVLNNTFELYLACAEVFETGPSFLVVAVSEDGAFGFEAPTESGHVAGAVSGATKSFAREYPDSLVRVLDLHPGLEHPQVAKIVARSLTEAFALETGISADTTLRAVRLVPTHEATDDNAAEPDCAIRSGDVVMVTGGARGITAECLRHLTRKHRLTLAIIGRTPMSDRAERLASFDTKQWEEEKARIIERMKREGTPPTPVKVEKELSRLRSEAEVFSTLADLRSTGSEVMYRSIDIRDRDAVHRVVEEVGELCDRVDVVIHAAGIDISRALRSKSLEEIQTVVSVKIDGMRYLLDALAANVLPPRRIVGFGSVSGRFGNMAQIDYSAANDGMAHLLRWADKEQDAKASTIDWAPWSDIGMATLESVQRTLEEAGIDFIPPHTGVEIFERELARDSKTCEVLAAGRLGPFAEDAFRIPGGSDRVPGTAAGQNVKVLSLLPGEYVRLSVTLDPSHPLLDHHRIDRAAVLPGVGGIEIMRFAGMLLNPDAAHADFENVSFSSPLKIFHDDPFDAEVEVVREPATDEATCSYSAKIFSWFQDKQGRKVGSPRLHHECRLEVRPDSAIQSPERTKWNASVWIGDHDLYKLFFHGPAFRFLDHVHIEGHGQGVRFRFSDTEQREDMFADAVPAAVEAAFQAAAAFGVEARGVMALPTGAARVDVIATDRLPYEGELTLVRESTLEEMDGRKILLFNGIVKDSAGNALLNIHDIRMVELEQSTGFTGKIFEDIAAVENVIEELEADEKAFLDATLDHEEAKEHAQKKIPKRAREWITGRVALKTSVQRLVAACSGGTVNRKSIRITTDEHGKPYAELPRSTNVQVGGLSLSHSNGLAIAMSTTPEAFDGLGVDIEKVEPRSQEWANDYFTDEEIRSAHESGDPSGVFTRMWSLKEAALKAMGIGLRLDLKDINVSRIDHSGRASLDFRNEAARYAQENSHHGLEARVEENDGKVIARVVMRK